jgi:AAA+ superfamily predicted ATPase
MTSAVSIFSRKAGAERRPSAADADARPIRRALALAIDFAAKAIKEALARRSPGAADAPYSAAAEIERLTAELAQLDRVRLGLDPAGEAARARAALEDHLFAEADDPLARLEHGLALSRGERDVLRMLLAWSVEPRIGLLIGHVHDALQKTRPTIGAIAEILHDPVGVALALAPTGALRRTLAVEAQANGPDVSLGLDPRIVHWALTGAVAPWTMGEGSLAVIPSGALPDAAVARADEIADAAVVVIRGAPGSGRRTVARAIAAREDRPLLHLDLRAKEAPEALVTAAMRDARVADARLLVTGALDDAAADRLARAEALRLAITLAPAELLPEPLLGRPLTLMALGIPSAAERAAILREALRGAGEEDEIRAVAERYAFTPGQIGRAALQAHASSLDEACRLQLRHRLDGVGARRPTTATWERLVLPEPALASLRAMASQVRHRRRVGEAWGFDKHHNLGHGVKALFFGKPGTGKTLAAEIVAGELGMPLYRIDIPRIVSKWIGETEQNLARVFDEATQSHAVIFFDEADSLFGRRTAIESATDRYANMEVNYLLQRIEEHDGVVILATNLKANMDEGFARRLHFAIEFPEPDDAARARIWRLSLPPGAPVHPDVDFAALGRRFDIAGGAIKNVVLGAAYLAAAEDSPILPRHIGVARAREYTKMDRLYNRAELAALLGGEARGNSADPMSRHRV